MADTNPSPILGLPVPVVDQAPGPQWAQDINSCLQILDSHGIVNASSGFVTPAGIDINSDLLFNNFNATLVRSIRYQSQTNPLATPLDLSCSYAAGVDGDFYFNDGNGNQIQITANGGIAGSPGSISNLDSPASASYVAANDTFVWQSDVSTAANLDAASVLLRNLTANSKALTLQPPAAMGANYSITLPALPLSESFLTMDTSGVVTCLPESGAITGSMVAASAGILGSQLAANAGITRGQLTVAAPVVTASSGNFGTQSLTPFVQVPNLSASITTIGGGPVEISIQSMTFSGGVIGEMGVNIASYSGANPPQISRAIFGIFKSGVNICSSYISAALPSAMSLGSGLGFETGGPPSITYVDLATVGTPGTYSYALMAIIIPGTGMTATAFCNNARMVLREL